MNDLFAPSDGRIRFPVEGADLELSENFISREEADFLLSSLLSSVSWRHEKVMVWGKSHFQPRLISWIGDASYTYSGLTLDPEPWPEILHSVRERVERFSGVRFNSLLLNLYRNEDDRMGAHSDDETELGNSPTIASLSVGSVRRMRFLPREKSASLRPFKILLSSGSLLLMKGQTQRNWLHEIPKESSPTGPRINMTFRKIIGV